MNNYLVNDYYYRLENRDLFSHTDILTVREIIRQFLAKAVNLDVGHEGILYRLDRDSNSLNEFEDETGEIVDTVSDGYVDAKYEDGVELYIQITGLKTDVESVSFPRGVQEQVVLQGLSVMCPEIQAGDVWKDNYNNTIYYLKPVKTMASVKTIPILSGFQMFKLPETAPEYKL